MVAEPAVTAVLDPLVRSPGVGPPSGAGPTTASMVIALGGINILHVVVGEQAPTYLGVERSKLGARYGATPLYYWRKLMWPVIIVADRTAKLLLRPHGVQMTRSWTEEDLEDELEEGEELPASRGELRREMGDALRKLGVPAERRQEVFNALDIGERPVREVTMEPDGIVVLSTPDDLETNLETVREYPPLAVPTCGREAGGLPRGRLHAPILRGLDALRSGETTLAEIAAPPMTVSPEEEVSGLIDRF